MTELIVTLEDSASATILRKAISLLKGVKKVVAVNKVPLSKEQTEQLDRVKEIAALKKNWDGEGALPISKTVIKNAKSIINKSNDIALSMWTFFPEVNGTILLQKNDNSACISIGNKSFTAINGNEVKSKQPFSAKEVVSLIS